MLTAFITGGANGIGRAAASAMARKGYKVWIGDRDVPLGHKTADAFRNDGLDVSFVEIDVTNETSIRAAADLIASQTSALNVLINNAGRALDDPGETGVMYPSKLATERLRGTFDVNFFGSVAVTQIFLPLVLKSEAGRIVNVSSHLGSFTINTMPEPPDPTLNALAYKSSKAALNMATLAFASELRGTNVKVNSAAPTYVPTDSSLKFIGAIRAAAEAFGPGSPEEGAEILVKLATLPDDGPTGEFWDMANGKVPW